MNKFKNLKTRRFLFIFLIIIAVSFVLVQNTNAATEFATTVNTDGGGDYSSLSLWEAAINSDLATTTTKVINGSLTRGSFADGAAVTQTTSGATATMRHDTATQIMLVSVSGVPNSTNTWYPTANGNDATNAWTPTDAGDDVIATVELSGTAADTTAVTINGWTTDAARYINIYTTSAARHQGVWDNNKYRLTSSVFISEDYVRIQGLQITVAVTGNGYGVRIGTGVSITASEIWLSNNIIKTTTISGNYNRGIWIDGGAANKIWNNIIYDWSAANAYGINNNNNVAAVSYIYNNTITNSSSGINSSLFNQTFYVKNNIVQGATVGYYSSGSWGSGSDYNVSNIASDAPSPSYRSGLATTVVFADEINGNFHLAYNDTGAKNQGVDLSADANLAFTTDIDGDTRSGAWDIGADEYRVNVRMRGNVKMRGNVRFR